MSESSEDKFILEEELETTNGHERTRIRMNWNQTDLHLRSNTFLREEFLLQ